AAKAVQRVRAHRLEAVDNDGELAHRVAPLAAEAAFCATRRPCRLPSSYELVERRRLELPRGDLRFVSRAPRRPATRPVKCRRRPHQAAFCLLGGGGRPGDTGAGGAADAAQGLAATLAALSGGQAALLLVPSDKTVRPARRARA